MKRASTAEDKAKYKPRMGKKIISVKQARSMAGQLVEEESFMNDKTVAEVSMEESYRRPTMEEMRAASKRQKEERAAENRASGRTGKELYGGELPRINFKMPVRNDVSSSESEADMSAESDKENGAIDESMKEEEEIDKEADETTPVATSHRSKGTVGPSSSSSTPADNNAISSTPPSRPNSEFKRPALPVQKSLPRHSTPKANIRPRESFGALFNDISSISNNSLQGVPPGESNERSNEARSTNKTRKASIESRGPPTLNVLSIDEEDENEYGVSPRVNGRSIEQPSSNPANGTYVVGGEEMEEEEEEDVQVHIEAVDMRRSTPISRDRRMERMDGEDRVQIVGVTMRRQRPTPPAPPRPSLRQSLPIQDATMMTIGDDSNGGRRDKREDSQEMMEDEEMASLNNTADIFGRQSARPAKRPSIEHPITAESSPMAVMMARRRSGLRETMMKPKVSMQSTTNGRKISTGSVGSSIPLEEISQNMSMSSTEQSYEEPTTPVRTPRTTRQLRQSLADRQMRQSQLPMKLPILEEDDVHGGESEDEEEEEEEEEMEMNTLRRVDGEQKMNNATTPTTPVNRVPRLSQRLQSSVDRLSQPRHRHEQTAPCPRLLSPARVPTQRSTISSPSPARRFNSSINQTRGMMISGFMVNQRIDTTLMEDNDSNAKSGMAPRIKRIPRRGQGGSCRSAVLRMSGEQSYIEQIRREKERKNARMVDISDHREENIQPKEFALSHGSTSTFTSPNVHGSSHSTSHATTGQDDHYDSFNDDRGQEYGEEEEGGGGNEEEVIEMEEEENNYDEQEESLDGSRCTRDEGVFVRPALPPTPTSANAGNRRSNASSGTRIFSDSDGNEDVDRLSSRASQISIDDGAAVTGGGRRAGRTAATSTSYDSFDDGRPASSPPQTPFRRTVARNSDLYSTDTPGIDRGRRIHGLMPSTPQFMDTEEEDEWAAEQNSNLWRGDVTTEEDENVAAIDESQISIVEDEDSNERVLAPRKLIEPSVSPTNVRRSQRTRMKPVRAWLGEQAQYALSPNTGSRKLIGVNTVVIKDKLFVKTGTADIQKAVEARKKTAKQRGIANKKRKEQKRAPQQEEEESD